MEMRHQVVKTEEKPVIKEYKALSKDEKEAVDILIKSFGMNEQEALTVFFNQESWLEWKSIHQRKMDIKDLDMATRLQEEVDSKIRGHSLGQAKEGYLTLSILRDKVLNQQAKSGPVFNVAGRQIQIKVGFPFKPYQKPEERLEELKDITEEDK